VVGTAHGQEANPSGRAESLQRVFAWRKHGRVSLGWRDGEGATFGRYGGAPSGESTERTGLGASESVPRTAQSRDASVAQG